MELKILLLLNLFVYAVVVGQSFLYIVALRNVQESMEAPAYIELRKLLDRNFLQKFKPVMYLSLLLNLVSVISFLFQTSFILQTGAVIAFVAIVADALLASKGNMPINKIINTWTAESYPANWKDYRSKWMYWYSLRQIANISGFLALLIAAVFG
jgi:uncharacterized membrane protein